MLATKTLFRLSFLALLGNRLRSILSMLGIIIGVASVIGSLSLGESLKQHTLNQIRNMGTNLLIIVPTQKKISGVKAATSDNLTIDDVFAILNLDKIKMVSPVASLGLQLNAGGRNRNAISQGVVNTYFKIHGFDLEEGRFFSDSENSALDRVAVLGANVAKDLFPFESPLAKEFRIRNIVFRVIGVLKSRGEEGMSPDDQVIIPFKTMQKKLLGSLSVHRIDVSAFDEDLVISAEDDINKLLRQRHRIRVGEEADFRIVNMSRIMDTFNTLGLWFTIFLGAMAGISLLVGGIGIMNIMLVTVTERTAEIGVRKAIGAKDKDILRQFLIEAIVMTLTGGLIGTLISVGFLLLISFYFDILIVIPKIAVFLGIGFSTMVGLFFGYYPAKRAASLNPIDCLRYE